MLDAEVNGEEIQEASASTCKPSPKVEPSPEVAVAGYRSRTVGQRSRTKSRLKSVRE